MQGVLPDSEGLSLTKPGRVWKLFLHALVFLEIHKKLTINILYIIIAIY